MARATGELAGPGRTRRRGVAAAAGQRAPGAAPRGREGGGPGRGGAQDAAAGRRRGRLRRAVSDLAELLDVTRQVAAQTRQRLAGAMPDGATRRVSLHDGDARPIAKGRLGRPVEFGYKAQVTDNDDGVVLDYAVEQGNPADGPQLAPAIGRVIRRTGKKPRTVTADRGYGEQLIEDELRALGVRHVAIPRKGKPGKARQAAERRPAFRRAVKWRTGSEGRISALKRQIRMGPHPTRRHRRSSDLDRIRDPGPQPSQDQHPGQLTPARTNTGPASTTCPNSARRLFQVEVANGDDAPRMTRLFISMALIVWGCAGPWARPLHREHNVPVGYQPGAGAAVRRDLVLDLPVVRGQPAGSAARTAGSVKPAGSRGSAPPR